MRSISGLFLFGVILTSSVPVWSQECNVFVGAISFGSHPDAARSPLQGSGAVRVHCTGSIPFRVLLGPSAHNSGFSPRVMVNSSGAGTLAYNLFLDPSFTQIWGDGFGDTYTFVGSGNGTEVFIPVFGQIFGGQLVPPGIYSNSIMISVEW